MAFKKPEEGGPEKSYWATVGGSKPHDIHVELKLSGECGTGLKEKIEFAKVVMALLRLHASPHFALPVISNVPIEEAAAHSEKHHFVPVEPLPPFFSITEQVRKTLSRIHFDWTKTFLQTAIELNKEYEPFAFALSALDSWQTIRSGPLALVFLLAALENIFSPDKAQELRFRVSTLIASYLESPGQKRSQKFRDVLALYDARSKAAHGSAKHDPSVLYKTYDLLRDVVIKMIEEKAVPSKADLETKLFGG